MIENLYAAFGVAVLSMAVTEFTKNLIDRKPFNCQLCMTFWLSLFIFAYYSEEVATTLVLVGYSVFWRQLLYRVWATMF